MSTLVRCTGKYRGMYELRPRQIVRGIKVVSRYSKRAAKHLSIVHGIKMVDDAPPEPQKKRLFIRRRKTAGVRPFP